VSRCAGQSGVTGLYPRGRWQDAAKTMGRWGLALGPDVLKQVHERIVKIARDKGVTAGRWMRVDTTVVETDTRNGTPLFPKSRLPVFSLLFAFGEII
jgi:hypothetical protein